jgi:hypothetical protein
MARLIPVNDYTGEMVNGVEIIGYIGKSLWRVRFSCGHYGDVQIGLVKNRKNPECNHCVKSKLVIQRNTKHGCCNKGNLTYTSWLSMRRRCYDKSNNRYQEYGARGISVCEEWRNDFSKFLEDMGERPSVNYSIDRIDTNGDYTPENCKWSDRVEQANNKRNVRLITNGAESNSLMYWCKRLNIDYKRAWYLTKNKGVDIKEVLGENYRYV